MANTTIRIKKSVVTGNTPSSLANGEIALNSADGKLFYATPSGSISYLKNTNSFATINANNTLILAGSPTDVLSIIPNNNMVVTPDAVNKTITIGTVTNPSFSSIRFSDGSTQLYAAAPYDYSNAAYTQANTGTTLAQAAFNASNGVSSFANTTFATITYAAAAYGKANSANVLAQAAFNTANNAVTSVAGAGGNVSNNAILLGILNVDGTGSGLDADLLDGLQGTSYANTTFAQAGFDVANTATSNITILQGVNTAQNTSITIIQGVDTTQNTNITNVNTFAQAGFNKANTAGTTAVAGIVQLYDSYNGTSNTLAVTANAVGQLYTYTAAQIALLASEIGVVAGGFPNGDYGNLTTSTGGLGGDLLSLISFDCRTTPAVGLTLENLGSLA